MPFGWWKRRQAAKEPLPEAWRAILHDRVPFFRAFTDDQRRRFEAKVNVFVRTKHFEGAGGFEVTDEVRVIIAATAARLTMSIDGEHYERLSDIVVYPAAVRHPEDGTPLAGQAFGAGTVILSWQDTLAGLADGDGENVGFHEFAHVLDREDGHFDGTPELHHPSAYGPWAKYMSHAFEAHRAPGRGRRPPVIDPYGATNEAEFFAEATVAFFEKPQALRARHPRVYELLRDYFKEDPAAQR